MLRGRSPVAGLRPDYEAPSVETCWYRNIAPVAIVMFRNKRVSILGTSIQRHSIATYFFPSKAANCSSVAAP